MLAAVLCFAFLDAAAKYANATVPVLQIIFVRYAVHLALAVVLFRPWRDPSSLRVRRPLAHVARSLLLVVQTLFNFIALQSLQLTEAVTITFLAPLIITALSVLIFGERVGPRRWAAIAVGFLGVVIAVQPGLEGFKPATLLLLLSVFGYSGYVIMTRLLAPTMSPGTLVIITALVPTLALMPVMPFVWVWPEPVIWLPLFVTGLAGGLGHYLLIVAHRHVPAGVLAPFAYMQIIWMIGLGYLVFSDVPGRWTLAGAAVIIGSGLYLLSRERRLGRTAVSTPPPAL
jgi:drug/metabolite transporter (DMT)-like permease